MIAGQWGVPAGFVEQVATPDSFEVQASLDVGKISLSWQAQDGVQFYRAWCGLSGDSMDLVADNILGTSYTIAGLSPGQQYFVQVTGVRSPRSSMPSVLGAQGSGGGLIVPLCTPIAADVCYQLIQANAEPLAAGSTPDPGFGTQPYLFDFPIDWSDDSACGWDVAVTQSFSLIATIDHNRVQQNRRKQRRVIFRLADGNASSFVVMSNPAVGGDPMPSGTYPAGTTITIDFTSDCSGSISARVTIAITPMTWAQAAGWGLSNDNLTAALPASYFFGSSGCVELYSPINAAWGAGTVTANFAPGDPSPFVGGEIRIQFSAPPPPNSTQRVVISMPASFPFNSNISFVYPGLIEQPVTNIVGPQTRTIDFSSDASGAVSFVVS